MTQYIQLLKSQRQHLASRARCDTYFESMLRKYMKGGGKIINSQKSRAKVQKLDQLIAQESKSFGDLRFKVMGTYGR